PTSELTADPFLRTPENTAVGAVMGTPGYMAPEQGRGEAHNLDARCDVFALGAILCHILTGRPPFIGGDTGKVLRQTADGDLAEACAALERCGADAELVGLARSCLAPRREDRLADAGAVADAISRYEAQVQERLHQTELEKEKAQVQATEE